MATIFQNERIAARLFVVSKNNSALCRLNNCMNKVSQLTSTKVNWILYRRNSFERWVKRFEILVESSQMFTSFNDYLAYRLYPAHSENSTIDRLMKNPKVLVGLLKHMMSSKTKEIEIIWNAIVAEGSLLGISYCTENISLNTILHSNVTLVTNAFYARMYQADGENKKMTKKYIDLLVECRPLKSVMDEYLQYSILRNDREAVNQAIQHMHNPDNIYTVLYTASLSSPDIFSILYTSLSDETKNSWDTLNGICESKDKDEVDLYVSNLFANKRPPVDDELAAETWSIVLENAVTKKSKEIISVLLNYVYKQQSELFVSLGVFNIAIQTGDKDLCNLLVTHIDCLHAENSTPQEKIHLILTQFCQIRPRTLFARLFPHYDMNLTKVKLKAKLVENQCKIVEYLVGYLQEIDPTFIVGSPLLWSAYQEGNVEVAQKLQNLGGIAQWMDNNSASKIKRVILDSGEMKYHVEDSKVGMFLAYGGNGLEIDQPVESIQSLLQSEECLFFPETTSADYSHFRRPSAEKGILAGSPLTAIAELSMYSPVEPKLGGRRISVRKLNTAKKSHQRVIPRPKSAATENSDKNWTNFLLAPKSELKIMLEKQENGFEWMDNSDEPILPIKDENSTVDPRVTEMALLY
jgi:hypothetical protein